MNKAKVIFIVVSLLLIPSIGICESDGWTGNLNLVLGIKYLDSDDWSPVDKPLGYGILLDFRPKKWPLNIAIDYLEYSDTERVGAGFLGSRVAAEADIREIGIGIRKIWENSPTVRPYIGGGVAFIDGEFWWDAVPSSEDDNGTGYWINAGVYWTLSTPGLSFGFDFRYSQADITLFGRDIDAGGSHYAVLFGFHW